MVSRKPSRRCRWGARAERRGPCGRRARSGPAERARASASRPATSRARPAPAPAAAQRRTDGLSIKTTRREHSHAVTTQPRSLVHSADTRHTQARETLYPQLASRKEVIITSDYISAAMAENDWGYSCENGEFAFNVKVQRAPRTGLFTSRHVTPHVNKI